ncbi:MAG: exodeoxyribonuclease III [Acidimicrobiia bacterium]
MERADDHRTSRDAAAPRRLRRIVSWNVNSIRSRTEAIAGWIDRHDPDVVLLQETRCADPHFPFGVFESRGYAVAHHGANHRNGVAIASRIGLDAVRRGFEPTGEAPFDEARLISARCGGVRIHSVYVPNGRAVDDPHYVFKLAWLDHLRAELAADLGAGVPTIVAGDFNVAPADLDIYDPVQWRRRTHASPPERAAIAALEADGLVDVMRSLDPSPGLYTWWNYRPGQFEKNRGLRIDLVLASAELVPHVRRVWVDVATRGDLRPSDHAPVVLDLDDTYQA